MHYLGFEKFDEQIHNRLKVWLTEQAKQRVLPDELFKESERYLLANRTILPGPSVLERLIIHVCSQVHTQLFASLYHQLPIALRNAVTQLLTVPDGAQHSSFYQLKAYPPAATVSSLQTYLKNYKTIVETGIEAVETNIVEPAFLDYLFKLAKRYSAKDLKRFNEQKRYALMICFLSETRKILLDHLVKMHDQYLMEICRHSKNAYEQHHRAFRTRQKKAIDLVLDMTHYLLDWPEAQPLTKQGFFQRVNEETLRASLRDLHIFKRLEERGYADLLLARYPSMRKYFATFIHLPFAAAQGSETLIQAIHMIRKLDAGVLSKLPDDAPIAFVPKELRRCIKDKVGTINRNAWEMGLAFAMKGALRSGDLYLPQSKHHVSFWSLTLSESRWQEMKDHAFAELGLPRRLEVRTVLTKQFHEAVRVAKRRFKQDRFATIQDGKLTLKRDYKVVVSPAVANLQKTIDASLPSIRIEQLLMDVDQHTQFSRHFTPIQKHQSRPTHFYKTLMAAIIFQATNLGVVSKSGSVSGITVDMLRHVLHYFIREETIQAASAEIVNRHHELPLSAVHGRGTLSSSDTRDLRFGGAAYLLPIIPGTTATMRRRSAFTRMCLTNSARKSSPAARVKPCMCWMAYWRTIRY